MRLLLSNRQRRWRSRPREHKPAEIFQRRFLLLKVLIVLLFGVLVLQLARMQILEHDTYQSRAEHNRLRTVPVLPARGLIYDRNSVQLVQNQPAFAAAVVPADVPEERFLPVVAELSTITGVPAQEIVARMAEAQESADRFLPVVVKPNLDEATAFRLRERQADLPGVQVLVESARYYPSGPLASHVLGYVGRIDAEEYPRLRRAGYQLNDRLGKTGVELVYESVLRGTPGYRQVEVDVAGREIRTLRSTSPRPAGNLVLALDFDLQRKVADYLQAQLGESLNAAAIVMDVRTGGVLAMVSLPAYDNNAFAEAIDESELERLLSDPAKPLVDHAIAGVYPPGSTFKQVTGTAALQEGVATAGTTIATQGFISIPNRYNPSDVYVLRDWRNLGTLNFYRALAMSSNIYFSYLAGGFYQGGQTVFEGLGAERLAQYAHEYGLGAPTGIDLPGEAAGLVPHPAWKEEAVGEVWTLGDTYNFGIGQGYLALTPLQLLLITVAIANGGDVLVPQVVREVVDNQGNVIQRIERQVARTLSIADENLAIMREALRQSATYGVARGGTSSLVSVAGKTGTAEFGPRRADGPYRYAHSWYVGFAPFEDPEIALVVFFEKEGPATHAAPVAKQVFDYYFGRQRLARDGGTP